MNFVIKGCCQCQKATKSHLQYSYFLPIENVFDCKANKSPLFKDTQHTPVSQVLVYECM